MKKRLLSLLLCLVAVLTLLPLPALALSRHLATVASRIQGPHVCDPGFCRVAALTKAQHGNETA